MGNCSLTAVTDSTSTSESNHYRTTSRTSVEVLTPPKKGVWRVKLVIDQKDLERILSEDVNTEMLIEQMRIAANSTPMRGNRSCNGINDRFGC